MMLAKQGYQLEPEALDLICSYPGSKDDLISSIIGQMDQSVAVIRAFQVSSLLDSTDAPGALLERSSALPASCTSSMRAAAELKCDITGRSTCVGDYDDFVRYFRDRYTKIREMLSRRLNARPIESTW